MTITESALISRINRKLPHPRHDNWTYSGGWEKLRKARRIRDNRGLTWPNSNLGDYYVVDVMRNRVLATHVSLEELARELGVLRPYESLGGAS
jgi:hypothetical protein